jgi:hypothetical protein
MFEGKYLRQDLRRFLVKTIFQKGWNQLLQLTTIRR